MTDEISKEMTDDDKNQFLGKIGLPGGEIDKFIERGTNKKEKKAVSPIILPEDLEPPKII